MVKLPLCFLACLVLVEGADEKIINDNLPELGQMNFMELCETFTLNCEAHDVITEDGYILTLHHIIGDSTRPVLMWHGFLDSSDSFILRGHNATGSALAAEGYDVWIGNARGNTYSRRHSYLDPDKHKELFWDFSVHEVGYYDLPATVDYVLAKTGQKKLYGIGYSQGTAIFHILCSTRPSYNDKFNLYISMGPFASFEHIGKMVRDFLKAWTALSDLPPLADAHALAERGGLVQKLCTKNLLGLFICREFLMGAAGRDLEEIDIDFFKVIMGHFPSGTSKKTLDHYGQVFDRKRFAHYDYGIWGNLERYDAVNPPDYEFDKIVVPVALLVGKNDLLTTVEDAEVLRKQLPNVVFYKVMDREKFNHLDFVWAENINTYVNPILKDLLRIIKDTYL